MVSYWFNYKIIQGIDIFEISGTHKQCETNIKRFENKSLRSIILNSGEIRRNENKILWHSNELVMWVKRLDFIHG